MNRSRHLKARQYDRAVRGGFTIIELVVAIAIIAVLVALIVPAIQQARGAARRLQCKNNLRNMAVGLIQETETKQRFPPNGNFGVQGGDFHNWVVTILPYIEQGNIYNKWKFDEEFDSPDNFKLGSTHIPVLSCPDDHTTVGAGDLSYVINGGFGWTGPPCGVVTASVYGPIDLNGNGLCTFTGVEDDENNEPTDRTLMFQTGLTCPANYPTPRVNYKAHNMGTIRDGASQTMMLTENVHTGFDPASTNGNWSSPHCWRIAFFISARVCKDFSCTPGNVDLSKANDKTQAPYKYEALNAPFQVEGACPWPTSFHSGGLNAAFCDGSVRFLSESLDGRVYYSMVTPQGTLIKGPLAEGP